MWLAPMRAVRNRLEGYYLKSYLQIVILIISVALVSCFRPATPDDDLISGILLGDIIAVQQALDRGAKCHQGISRWHDTTDACVQRT